MHEYIYKQYKAFMIHIPKASEVVIRVHIIIYISTPSLHHRQAIKHTTKRMELYSEALSVKPVIVESEEVGISPT